MENERICDLCGEPISEDEEFHTLDDGREVCDECFNYSCGECGICGKIVPEDEIYLRVNKDNPASLHVMLKNNGTIVAEDESHYFVRIKKFGA